MASLRLLGIAAFAATAAGGFAPRQPRPHELAAFAEDAPTKAELDALRDALAEQQRAYDRFDAASFLDLCFWRPSCVSAYSDYLRLASKARKLQRIADAKLANAKSNLGIWSPLAIAEADDAYWEAIGWGSQGAVLDAASVLLGSEARTSADTVKGVDSAYDGRVYGMLEAIGWVMLEAIELMLEAAARYLFWIAIGRYVPAGGCTFMNTQQRVCLCA